MPQEVNSREIQQIKESQEVTDFVSKTLTNVLRDDSDRQIYLNKIVNAYNQRQGNKLESDVPWPGAANISMPFTDKIIRKFKPSLVLSLWNPRKLANVKVQEGVEDPVDPESVQADPQTGQQQEDSGKGVFEQRAQRAELALNHFLRRKMDFLEQLNIGVDYFLEKGRVYYKIYEDFKTVVKNKVIRLKDLKIAFGEDVVEAIRGMQIPEIIELLITQGGFDFDVEDEEHIETMRDIAKRFKAGEEEIDFDLTVIESRPFVLAIPPEQILVPSGSRRRVEDMWRITHEFYMTENDLRNAAVDGQFNKELVEDRLDGKTSNEGDQTLLEAQQSQDEGMGKDNIGRWKIWEIHTFWKAPGSKRMEKWVITTFASEKSSQALRIIREPNDDNEFPFVAHDNEIRSDRALNSRGIPEMLYDVQETIDKMESNRINRDTVQNVPMFTVKRSANMESQSVQFIPGEGILVDNHDDITPFNPVKGVDIASERIESIVKAYGEEYIGSIDFAFGNKANAGRGAKTLGEIQIAQGEAQKIANLDMLMLQDTFTKVYTRVFKLLGERFTGKLVIDGEVISRQDFNFPFEVTANGTIEDSDKNFKAQKLLNRMQVQQFQDPSYVTVEDKYNAYLDFLEIDGVQEPERFSTDPNIVLGQQITQLQQQIQQLGGQSQLLMEGLQNREKELAQVEEKARRANNKLEVKRNVVNNKLQSVQKTQTQEE